MNDFAVPRMERSKQRPVESMEEVRDWERLFVGEVKPDAIRGSSQLANTRRRISRASQASWTPTSNVTCDRLASGASTLRPDELRS
ncbi:MAG: hypothetical protein GEU99_13320 [Luteitalea sp.]|nr:hypothetical protein [Luteitalea sp.]